MVIEYLNIDCHLSAEEAVILGDFPHGLPISILLKRMKCKALVLGFKSLKLEEQYKTASVLQVVSHTRV